MNLVTAEHLTKSYTERLLFDDTDFSINEGDKIGLIGINGTGKSTLLKLVRDLRSRTPAGSSVDGIWISDISLRTRYSIRARRCWRAF